MHCIRPTGAIGSTPIRIQRCPLCPDGYDEIVEIHPYALGFDDELLDFVAQQASTFAGASVRGRCHDRAEPRPCFEPALGDQMLNDLVRRVRMNFEVGRERAHRGECLSRLEFAADERLDRCKHDLIEDRLSGLQLESE